MHQYLAAIGFDEIKTKKELRALLLEVEKFYDFHELMAYEEEIDFGEFKKEYAEDIGIAICGELDSMEDFDREYYFPYVKGRGVTSFADITVERRIEKEEYIGICEDAKVGVSLIFHLQNGIHYMREKQLGNLPKEATSVTLAGLALEGVILLPIKKNEAQVQSVKEESRNRMMLISAAREGDAAAIESLTLDDIDIYSKVSQRLVTEDVLSIVDTYFMPYGIECDRYSIMGEITAIQKEENVSTKEELYRLTLDVNELQFDVCVPENKLVGEPTVGRRFKGNIWLQGYINF